MIGRRIGRVSNNTWLRGFLGGIIEVTRLMGFEEMMRVQTKMRAR